ncbi:MAG TPA: hypothetical protein VJA66_07820 [Thermoanaerobaculia bacterium]
MHNSLRRLGVALLVSLFARLSIGADKPVWPLTLREGLPSELPGYAPAPKDELPEDYENEMGKYVEIGRFFQRIESATSTKQFRIVIQDYDVAKDLEAQLRKAIAEAKKAPGVEAREIDLAGRKTFVVTDRSQARPTTLVTVVVSPERLVLGQGSNVSGDEAISLIRVVDLGKVAAVKKEPRPKIQG